MNQFTFPGSDASIKYTRAPKGAFKMPQPSGDVSARSELETIVSALTELVGGRIDQLSAARRISSLLSSRSCDWRDLVRALAVVRGQNSELLSTGGTSKALDGVALLAMRIAAEPRSVEPSFARSIRAESLHLREVCAAGRLPEHMLRDVITILRSLLPFDLATYVEFETAGDDGASVLVRARFAIDGENEFRWPSRWLTVPNAIVEWMAGRIRSVSDIEQFHESLPDPASLRKSPVAREYAQRGARSFLTIPRRDGDRVVSTLMLARREGRSFSQDDQDLLDQVGLEQVLRLIGGAYVTRGNTLRAEIRNLFHVDAEPAGIARTLVRQLGEEFGWEYVGVFRVARARSRFETVAEYDPLGTLSSGSNYTQPLDQGMLGATLAAGKPLYAGKVNIIPPPYGYIQTRQDQKSSLCYPIHLGPSVEWIIDCESNQEDAFQQPDVDAIKAIVVDAEKTLALWFETRLNRDLLEHVSEGVVLVDEMNRVERLNIAARRMLGERMDGRALSAIKSKRTGTVVLGPVGLQLEEFGANSETKAVLGGSLPASENHVRLRGLDAMERGAIASSRVSAFNRRIWLLSDLAEPQWRTDLEYMRATVQGVAAQTRGALLLASALTKQASNLTAKDSSSGRMSDILKRVAENLAKADITYERLTTWLEAIRDPVRRRVPFDITGALTRFAEALPEWDKVALKFSFPPNLPTVNADPERLSFALRSILGHLLAVRPLDARIDVTAWVDKETLSLEMQLNCDLPSIQSHFGIPNDIIQEVEAQARATVDIAIDAAEVVIDQHGGRIEHAHSRTGTRFTITKLPLAEERRTVTDV